MNWTMKRMAQLLRDVRNGKTDFTVDETNDQAIAMFQPDASRLMEAGRLGYLVQVLPVKGARGGALYYRSIHVIQGLTFQGEQFLAEHLEDNPDAEHLHDRLRVFRSEHVSTAWEKALSRVGNDPSGAITAARALLESVCKQILHNRGIAHSQAEDFGVLWKKVTQVVDLGLAPAEVEAMRRFLGACNSVVGALAELRNRSGDAHGGPLPTVSPTHARFVVNVAGALAGFLAETIQSHTKQAR